MRDHPDGARCIEGLGVTSSSGAVGSDLESDRRSARHSVHRRLGDMPGTMACTRQARRRPSSPGHLMSRVSVPACSRKITGSGPEAEARPTRISPERPRSGVSAEEPKLARSTAWVSCSWAAERSRSSDCDSVRPVTDSKGRQDDTKRVRADASSVSVSWSRWTGEPPERRANSGRFGSAPQAGRASASSRPRTRDERWRAILSPSKMKRLTLPVLVTPN